MKELLANIVIAMRKVFKVIKVNFLFQCKETIDLVRKEGCVVKYMQHAHQSFYALMPENTRKEDFKIDFCFKNMTDVMKGKVF